MDARFLFFAPVVAVTCMMPVPSYAVVYMTLEQAQTTMFPGAEFTQDFRALTPAQVSAIEKASGTDVSDKQFKLWKVSTGGWFISDEVLGKHDFVPFVVGLDASGAIKGVEVLEYKEAYGSEIQNPKWLAQFIGKNNTSPLKLTKDIQNISGSTLSSKHITDGVKRILTTYAVISQGT